jgi:hypothetical protein
MENLLSIQELEEKIKNLVGIEKWYYDSLPDICWSSEDTQVKNLRAKGVNTSRTKLRRVKNTLIEEGLLQLEILPNGNRKNKKHILRKTYPISKLVERGDRLGEREDPYTRYTPDNEEYTPDNEEYTHIYNIQWDILQKYTAQEINSMDRIDRIKLYMDCGFIVLPTAYPVFTEDRVVCSCRRGINCPSIGKHPIHRYKYIDPFNYEGMKDRYLKEFENNPDLNVGFKVMGYSVLDVDNKNAGDQSLAHLLREYEINMENVISVKCSNGQHIYASNTHLKNTAGVVGNGLDVRSERGFVVAPGSVHKSGTLYQWNEIGEVATMPNDWFYTETEENEISSGKKSYNRSNQAAGKKLKDIILPKNLTSDYVIKKGDRELTLFKWACRERGNGANAEQLFDRLVTIRDTYCEEGKEPVTDEEVREIAESASLFPTNAQKKLSSFDPQNN